MDLNNCVTMIQTYLSDVPLVVLGSGNSASYGLPTMTDLSNEIIRHEGDFDQSDEVVKDFFDNIRRGLDLETAIGMGFQLNSEDINLIREIIWNYINKRDLDFFERGLKTDFIEFSLVDLIKKIISPTPYKANIITTNYDRLAEYAADIAGASIVTGFEGSYFRKMELPSESIKNKRIKARERTVAIWKVHGSLDWFLSPNGSQCDLPRSMTIPDTFIPHIVPPGNNKYYETHQDPYRSVISQADSAIANAKSFLVVGYGFNDSHIQPKIIEEIKKGTPIVVITKTFTSQCKELFSQSNIPKYILIEERDGKTHVLTKDWEADYEDDFWSLKGFLNKW
ncbi:MAG: SIR2 family protein [Clostridiales bacterium]|nr:SIR2 family protein [Clostridiales bacterium]